MSLSAAWMASGCLLTGFITYFTSEKKDQKRTFLWVYRGTESHLASVVACTHVQAQANKFLAAVHLKATSVANNKSFWILLIAPLNFSHLCHKVFFRNHKPLFWRFFRLTTHGKMYVFIAWKRAAKILKVILVWNDMRGLIKLFLQRTSILTMDAL